MELDFRGTPIDQYREYLAAIGGQEQPDGSFAGPGWAVTLTESEYRVFGMVMPRVLMQFTGDPPAVEAAVAALRLRSMRAGG
ncbi:MAG TPA: hypothetical protein VGK74_20790 [Symbiobacteriaceae bacterium]|jgi:hypothetical protein